MIIYIAISLLIAIVSVIFALQNLTTVTVSFFFWKIQASLALVLLITLTSGVFISLLASMPGVIATKWTIANQKKKLAALEARCSDYQQKADEAGKDISNLEEQLANLSSELEKLHGEL
jgi:uncharacterized integral membrane protein